MIHLLVQPPDLIISRKIRKLATKPLHQPAERRPTLKAIEDWGSWLNVANNPLVCRARSVPRPSSTPGLVLERPVPEQFDLRTVQRRRKGSRFKRRIVFPIHGLV